MRLKNSKLVLIYFLDLLEILKVLSVLKGNTRIRSVCKITGDKGPNIEVLSFDSEQSTKEFKNEFAGFLKRREANKKAWLFEVHFEVFSGSDRARLLAQQRAKLLIRLVNLFFLRVKSEFKPELVSISYNSSGAYVKDGTFQGYAGNLFVEADEGTDKD